MARASTWIPVGIGAGVLLLLASRASAKPSGGGSSSPMWPLVNSAQALVPEKGVYWGARAFAASRKGSAKYHAGIDLKAETGDPVVATEDGVVVATQGWDGPQAKALLLQTDSGPVMLYGAIAPNSWKEFGVGVGTRVKKGQPLGRVGTYPKGSHMLHFEIYREGTTKNYKWYKGDPAPANLLDPTNYLKRAADLRYS